MARIRALAAEAGRSVALLQDLSGPKIRTGLLRDHAPLALAAGDELVIAVGDFLGAPGRVSTSYEYLPSLVKPATRCCSTTDASSCGSVDNDRQQIRTTVVDGGVLGEHKGINAPGVPLPASGLTEKDKADLAFGVRAGVDFVAMSFVLSAADLRQARAALARSRRARSAARRQARTPGGSRHRSTTSCMPATP